MKEILDEIIELEWEQFTNTKNIGKRAYCQDRKRNFIFSRKAYWSIYNYDILISYLQDLKEGLNKDIHLVTHKYAYMMKYTDLENFKKIEKFLNPVSINKKNLVDTIMYIYISWLADIESKNSARPLFSCYDTNKQTSVETYMRGEYTSYSERTLNKILIYFLDKFLSKENLLLKNIEALAM